MPYVTLLLRSTVIYPHKVSSTPRWTGPKSHTHRLKTVIGGTTNANAKIFLRLLDETQRKMKEESDAPFCSIFVILSRTCTQKINARLHSEPGKGGFARETRFKLAFPPALPPQPPNIGALRVVVVLDAPGPESDAPSLIKYA